MCKADNTTLLKNNALAGARRIAENDEVRDCGRVAVIILPGLWKVLRSRAAALSAIIIINLYYRDSSYF